jgi:tryptophan 2-monooxygenase
MAHIPNLRQRLAPVDKFPYIDNLFDYGAFLGGATSAIGKMPPETADKPIAVVGAGIGGLICAYELLRAGAQKLVIFEATDRPGGRVYSDTYGGGSSADLAELGAMRFPPSEVGLFHYLNKFGITYNENFPDPGKVSTDIGYQGNTYPWPANEPPPKIFDSVNAGWSAFVSDGYQVPGGPRLAAPAVITDMLLAGDFKSAQAAWQQYLDYFENESFYSGLVTMFTGPNPPGGTPWSLPDDFTLFGALGLGSGGFGPLYPIGFLELVRLMVNELETSQMFVPGGITQLTSALMAQVVNGVRLGSLVRLGREVVRVSGAPGTDPHLQFADGTQLQFYRVVLATSNRAAQIDTQVSASKTILDADQASAVDTLHMTCSSKVFVRTSTKFWLTQPGLPANIQTDTLVRGVYCLDYEPQNPSSPGVVLLSYTWEDDSTKQLAMGDPETRVKRLVADLAQTNPDFARYVVPMNNDYDANVRIIDWEIEPHYYGAFKLGYPGTDGWAAQTFFQFQACKTPGSDPGIYLAGDSYSFTGGWIEGAVQTAINAACAVIVAAGGALYTTTNPVTSQDPKAYNYYSQPQESAVGV